jgi:hypothetical protein
MEILLTLTYVAICVAIFKIFRIPVNEECAQTEEESTARAISGRTNLASMLLLIAPLGRQ